MTFTDAAFIGMGVVLVFGVVVLSLALRSKPNHKPHGHHPTS